MKAKRVTASFGAMFLSAVLAVSAIPAGTVTAAENNADSAIEQEVIEETTDNTKEGSAGATAEAAQTGSVEGPAEAVEPETPASEEGSEGDTEESAAETEIDEDTESTTSEASADRETAGPVEEKTDKGTEQLEETVEEPVMSDAKDIPGEETAEVPAANDADEAIPTDDGEEAAQDAVPGGSCGEHITWTLEEDEAGLALMIFGSGDIYGYENEEYPWQAYRDQITKVLISDEVQNAPEDLFCSMEELRDISAPSAILQNSGFRGCVSLEEIILPEGITVIKDQMFEGCCSLRSIDLPESVTRIGAGAFKGCTSLKTINLPENLVELGAECFDNSGLMQITVPAGIETIGDYAFGHSDTETAVYFCGSKSRWDRIVDGKDVCYKSIQYGEPEEDNVSEDDTVIIEREVVEAYSKGAESKNASVLQITPAVTLSKDSFTYNGKVRKPSVTVKDGATVLGASDYSVTFDEGCREVGAYKVTVTMRGNYKGSKTAAFKILPKGSSITKLTAKEDELTVKWKKQKQQTTGYQIQYAADRSFKDIKTITVKDTDQTERVIRNLTGGKKYYVRMRTYKKSGSGTYCSKWSAVKAVKVKAHRTSFNVNREKITLTSGKTGTISVSPAGKASVPPLKWKSSNKKVAVVNKKGKITAKSVGTAAITVTSKTNSKEKRTVTVSVVPKATRSVTATNVSTGIRVRWKKVAGAKGYYLYRNGKKCATIRKGSKVTYTDKKAATNGRKYTYKVVAYAGSGKSKLSKSSSVYRLVAPDIITIKSVDTGGIRVKWTKNNNGNGYEIYYQNGKKKENLYWTETIKGKNKTSHTEKGLTLGAVYTVKIRAYKVVGKKKYYSPWSEVKSVRNTKIQTNKTKYNYSLEVIGAQYSCMRTAFVIKTDNPDPSSIQLVLIDENGHEADIWSESRKYNNITIDNGVARLSDSYVFSYTIDEPGSFSVYIVETLKEYEDVKKYVGKVTIKDVEKAYMDWVNSIVAKTTTSSMTKDQKMVAIANYLCENIVYYKNKDGLLVSLYEDMLVPDFIRLEYDSFSSPRLLVRFGQAIGYPLESMYGDYEYGSAEWSTYHHYAINRASGKMYSCCPFPESNTYNTPIKKITSADELKKAYESAMNRKTTNSDPFYWQ